MSWMTLPQRSIAKAIENRYLRGFCLTIISGMILLSGCREKVGIQSYEIPKQTSASATPTRLLAAMIQQADTTWFIKLTGEQSQVTTAIPNYIQIVRSVQFDSETKNPSWAELPDGWVQTDGNAFRFATIRKRMENGFLEITVSVLPTGPDWDSYVLQNVNRWRGQTGLGPLGPEQLATHTTKMPLEFDDNQIAVMVNLEGTTTPAAASIATGAPSSPPSLTSPQSTTQTNDIDFTAPAGWIPTANDSFSLHAFEIEIEGSKARVTISKLRGDESPEYLAANVNRWRAQVGLSSYSLAQLKSELKEIPFADGKARLIEAVPKPEEGQQGILGVIAIRNGTAWFIKMKGDAGLVQTQRETFEGFVRSIAFAK